MKPPVSGSRSQPIHIYSTGRSALSRTRLRSRRGPTQSRLTEKPPLACFALPSCGRKVLRRNREAGSWDVRCPTGRSGLRLGALDSLRSVVPAASVPCPLAGSALPPSPKLTSTVLAEPCVPSAALRMTMSCAFMAFTPQFGFHAAAVSSQQHGLSWFSELIPQKISLLLPPRTQGGGGGGALTETKSRVRGLKREMSQLESIQACLALKLEAQLQQGFRAQMNLQVSLGTRWWPIDPNNSAHPTASSHSWTDNHRASGLKARRGRASARASHFHAQSSSRIRQVNVHMQRLSLSATRCRVDGFGQHMGRAARIRRPQADESMRWPRGAADGCFPLEALFVV